MTLLGVVILCLAAAAIVSHVASAIVAGGSTWLTRWRALLTPAAEARAWLLLSVLPAALTGVVMVAALSPTFGWVADHCGALESTHVHPHICGHPMTSLPALPVTLLALYFVLRVAWALGRTALSSIDSLRTTRALARAASATRIGGAYVLPVAEPEAFVLGVFRPRVFVSRGLLDSIDRNDVATVLAHEAAHVARADGLRRFLARAVSCFHVPFVSARIDALLARAQEMAADEQAARAVGSRTRVADALVRLARCKSRAPREALAFHETNLELRVRSLLDDRPRLDAPRPMSLLLVTLGLLAVAALGASGIHHGLEHLLGVFGS